jgi:hypothetical protein
MISGCLLLCCRNFLFSATHRGLAQKNFYGMSWMAEANWFNFRPSDHDEPFAAIYTSDPAKVDKRTRSKWSRVLRYALQYKHHSEPLDQFIKRNLASTNVRAIYPLPRATGPKLLALNVSGFD